jgi:hypothetical protein
MLNRDLDEAEEQFQIALRAHLQTLDDIIDLQRNRIDALQGEYEQAVGVIKAEFSAERYGGSIDRPDGWDDVF